MTRFFLLLALVSRGLVSAEARVFDTEQQYVAVYGADVNKGAPAPPPHKFALYKKKLLRVVVLFDSATSQGELYSKPKSRLTEADVTGLLAANQGPSTWKKENVETTKDPKSPQVSLWSRKDGKLFAAYVFGSAPIPFLVVGTRAGGDFLLKQKDNLKSYIKE